VLKADFNSLPMLNKKIKICLCWDVNSMTGHLVLPKKLRDEGLAAFLGMVGYCMKDNREEHIGFVDQNVSLDDMIEGIMEHGVCEVWEGQSQESCESIS
jgi:hypothetical protein